VKRLHLALISLAIIGFGGFYVVNSTLPVYFVAAPFMVVGYFVAAYFLVGWPYAVFNELPMDVLQAAVGFAVAYPLSAALEDRLPRLR
jgi:uncharacterized membrane protein